MSQHTHKHSTLGNFEEREKILPSKLILENFGIRPGLHIADLGCGFGFFSLRAAEFVGPDGKIEAVDIEAERLEELQRRARERNVSELIETHLANSELIPLPDRSADIALLANILHELQDPLAYLIETKRVLKDYGEVWIVEWQKKETPMGPPLHERKSVDEWLELLEKAGFVNIWFQILKPAHVLIKGHV